MPTFVPVSDEILDDRNGRSTQKKSIGNKYNLNLFEISEFWNLNTWFKSENLLSRLKIYFKHRLDS